MGGKPSRQPHIAKKRRQVAEIGECLNSEEMSVRWAGNSLVIGLTSYGVDTHDIDDSDELTVETYPGGIWVNINHREGGRCDE